MNLNQFELLIFIQIFNFKIYKFFIDFGLRYYELFCVYEYLSICLYVCVEICVGQIFVIYFVECEFVSYFMYFFYEFINKFFLVVKLSCIDFFQLVIIVIYKKKKDVFLYFIFGFILCW